MFFLFLFPLYACSFFSITTAVVATATNIYTAVTTGVDIVYCFCFLSDGNLWKKERSWVVSLEGKRDLLWPQLAPAPPCLTPHSYWPKLVQAIKHFPGYSMHTRVQNMNWNLRTSITSQGLKRFSFTFSRCKNICNFFFFVFIYELIYQMLMNVFLFLLADNLGMLAGWSEVNSRERKFRWDYKVSVGKKKVVSRAERGWAGRGWAAETREAYEEGRVFTRRTFPSPASTT